MPEPFQPTIGCFEPHLAELEDASDSSSYLLDQHLILGSSTTCELAAAAGLLRNDGSSSNGLERSRRDAAGSIYPRLRGGRGG